MKTLQTIPGLLAAALIAARTAAAAPDYEQNIEKTLQVAPGGQFTLQADRGSVEVNTDQGNQVQVHVFRQVSGGTKANADELFANHEVTLTQDGNKVLAAALIAPRTAAAAPDYEQNIEKTLQVAPGGQFTLQADRGSVEVNTDQGNQVQVHVFRKVSGGTKANADELFANHEVTLTQDGNKVLVVAKNKTNKHFSWSINRPGMEVHYVINIPKKFDVELKTAGGNVQLADLDGEALAHTSSGSIKVGHVSGKLETTDAGGDIFVVEAGQNLVAKTSSGSVHVEKAAGSAEISDAGGNIRVEEAGADLTASTSSGSIKIGGTKGNVELRNAGGDVTIESAGGNVKASTSSGSIRVSSAKGKQVVLKDAGGNIEVGDAGGDVSVETSSGSIKVRAAKGAVIAKDAGGDVTLGEIGGDLVAQTSSGSVKVKAAKGKLEIKDSGGNVFVDEAGSDANINTSSGNIKVGTATGKLDAKNSGGSVEVTAAHDTVVVHTSSGNIAVNFANSPESDSRLEVSGGGIRVGLPHNAGVDLDAHASGGSVKSDLPVATTVQGEQPRSGTKGKINGGGPALFLRSSSGDIRVIESPAQQAEAGK